MNSQASMIISPSPGVRWTTDQDFLSIIDENKGCAYRFTGFEAALWSWLVLASNYSKVCTLTQAMLQVSLAEAEGQIRSVIQGWIASGLVTARADGEING